MSSSLPAHDSNYSDVEVPIILCGSGLYLLCKVNDTGLHHF
jgi:hypothetical protein